MKWLNLAVKPHFSWPNVQVEFLFEGYRIILQPWRKDVENDVILACTISVYDPNGITFENGGTIARRFLSRLAWFENGGVVELFEGGSNNPKTPGRLGQGTYGKSGYSQVEPRNYIYLPSAKSFEADLALGLFREGMSLNSAPFALLSYFKVLNISLSGGNSQKSWINNNLECLLYSPAIERLKKLRKSEPDIGAYLYHQGRCAVAHANGNPLVNLDSYKDKRRIEDDLVLIKEIAALYIEQQFSVRTDSSFRKVLRETNSSTSELLRKTTDDKGNITYVADKIDT